MKKIFTLFVCCWMAFSSYAQDGYRVFTKTVDGKEKYGIVNASGNVVAPAKYDWLGNEYRGGFITAYISELKTVDNSNLAFAPAKTGYYWTHNYGFIDVNGKELTAFKYSMVEDFNNGVASVSINRKWGLINTQGKEITPIKYEEIKKTYNDQVDAVLRMYYEYKDSKKKYGLLSINGRELTAPIYDEINSFNEGLATMQKNGMMGVLNTEGKEVVPARYSISSEGYKFVGGLCRVTWNGKWGFIDKTGKEVIPLVYDRVFGFDKDGTCMVRQGTLVGRIDKTGKVVAPLKYDRVEPFSDGLFNVKVNNLYGWIDQNGKDVIAPSYEYGSSFVGGIAYVRTGKFFGAINKNNEIKIPLKYEYISRMDDAKPLLWFKQNGKHGFFSETFTEITPAKYTQIYSPVEGRSFVRIDNKWGMVNDKGREIAEVKYDTLVNAKQSECVIAALNQKIGLIANDGKILIPVKYDNIFGYSEGMCAVLLNNKIGFVDVEGKEVIAPQFDDADDFINGKAQVKKGNDVFYIDKTGKKVQ
jgi:hypothetical protein